MHILGYQLINPDGVNEIHDARRHRLEIITVSFKDKDFSSTDEISLTFLGRFGPSTRSRVMDSCRERRTDQETGPITLHVVHSLSVLIRGKYLQSYIHVFVDPFLTNF